MSLAAPLLPLSDAPNQLVEASEEEIAAIAKALGHPARVHIVALLLEKQTCIGCDIVDEVGLAQSTVSEHLRILKSAGIVTCEVQHPRVCYRLDADRLRPLGALLSAVFDSVRRGELTGGICCSTDSCETKV